MRVNAGDRGFESRVRILLPPSGESLANLTFSIVAIRGPSAHRAQAEQGSAASIAILNRIADSRLVLLNNCGHWPPFLRRKDSAVAQGREITGADVQTWVGGAIQKTPNSMLSRTRPESKFAADSPLEGDGFEPSVPQPRWTGGSDFAAG
jgi:hypothetical protein